MKIIIAHSRTTRVILGSFQLCGSREDLKELERTLRQALNKKEFNYGWIEIKASQPEMPNTSPIAWDDKGS